MEVKELTIPLVKIVSLTKKLFQFLLIQKFKDDSFGLLMKIRKNHCLLFETKEISTDYSLKKDLVF